MTGDRTPTGDLPERLAEAITEATFIGHPSVRATALHANRHVADAVLPVVEAETAALRELLGDIWLYVDWRYVTRQLTTEQKEMWADAIEATADPEVELTVDRWWRE